MTVVKQLTHKQVYQQLLNTWLVNGLVLLMSTMSANAQLRVVTDGTTATTLTGSTDCTSTCSITGASIAGDNLFHSFSEFSIPEGIDVTFHDGGATNIFSRVSDPTQASTILGNLVVAPGAANFFLINPAGITFGPSAELRLNGGAFVASTAERVNFLDDMALIAGTPTEPVQLTISTPVGLQFGNTAAAIVNQSQASLFPNTLGAPAGLFNPLNTLALIGGDITLLGGNLTAPGGNIVLGSVGPESEVSLSTTTQGFEFGYSNTASYQNIQLLGSLVDVGGPGGGQVNLQGNQVNLDSSGIFGITSGLLAGGALNLNTKQLNLTESDIRSMTNSPAHGPDVNLSVDVLNMTNGSVLSAETRGAGDGGKVTITGQSQPYANTIALNTSGLGSEVGAGAAGQGGNVTIATANLYLQEAAGIVAKTFGTGNAGNLSITATTEIFLQDESLLETVANDFFQNPNAPPGNGIVTSDVGDAGDILLTTDQLTVQDSLIQATTFGDAGNGGKITVKAGTVTLTGASTNGQSSGIFSQVEPGQVTNNVATSQGGYILIEAGLLKLLDSALVSATARGAGTAGNITLRNMDRLEIIGNDTRASGVFAIGQGNGQAGEINVMADHIRLISRAQIMASTETSDGGIVTLRGTEDIILQETSLIAARAGEGGSGGNIIIETPFLIAIPRKDSDIVATAVNGPGGKIQITASSILGLVERPAFAGNGTNDIDASSQLGTDGIVIINRPNVEPEQGLANLPAHLTDATNQVRESCSAVNTSRTGRFTMTGRGGLPPNPEAAIRDRHLFPGLGDSDHSVEQARYTSSEILEIGLLSRFFEGAQLVEARGWMTGGGGEVILTDYATYHPHGNSQRFSPQCRQS